MKEGISLQILLVKKNKIHKIVLPRVIAGVYWINGESEQEEKLLRIDGDSGKWKIQKNDNIQLIDNENIVFENKKFNFTSETFLDEITLEEYSTYGVFIGPEKEFYLLFCMPVNENDYLHLKLKYIPEFTIGSDINNSLTCTNKYIIPSHVKISIENGKWILKSNFFGVAINNLPMKKESKELINGDIIFIMGLKIIFMNNSIYILNPQMIIKYDNTIFEEVKEQPEVVINESNDSKDKNIEQYSEKDYFSRAPRIIKRIETETVKIDPPPQRQNNEQMPAILVLGSSLSMSAIMLISVLQSIDRINNGEGLSKQTIISLVISGLLFITMLLIPILQLKYTKRQRKKYEEKRQERYKKYINKKIKEIDKIMVKQKEILLNNYASIKKCLKIIISKGGRLWERKIEDKDFLEVRLGIGDVPLDIDIQYPEKGFAMEDDNLVNILNSVGKKSTTMTNAPIIMSLRDKNISAIISQNQNISNKFLKDLILQIVTFHDYNELKLVFFIKNEKDFISTNIKYLPHVWNNSKDIRFFADNLNDMKEISLYLENEFESRQSNEDNYSPYYLIITDDFKTVEKLRIINKILSNKENKGFSLLCLTDDIMKLPNECKTFINLEKDKGTILESEVSSAKQKQTQFEIENTPNIRFDNVSKILFNIPIKYTNNISSNKTSDLPNSYSFLEMYNVGTIEQLNILERWRKNDSTLSLRAPIGIDSSGMLIYLDIHEKYHGPHGLIAGSTGSGKSEFIITYVLSLAINYHPDDLAFIIIDYKGGGLAGAFEKRDAKLPHLIGTITNIDTADLQRSLDSIQSELRRRQVIFNKARNLTEEGTIDIYKYQEMFHNKLVSEPIPHLLIICDEFAELKQQQPEFMDELISVARIGRSLGVHLILSTQKPAGIVNDQIRSNSKFGICLKVQEKEDSLDVIKKPDAAYLKNTGQFYLQVGNDEYFVLGQSAWANAPYIPTDIIKNKVDTSIDFISNIGHPIKRIDDIQRKNLNAEGIQLTNIVREISALSKKIKIHNKQLWLDSIPETIYLQNIKEKYNYSQNNLDEIIAIIGEYDDPQNQVQNLSTINFTKGGNVLIFGNASSGKETLLSTLTFDLITSYSPEQVQLYILDFGSESLKIFKNSPNVGDIVFINDTEKIDRFFEMIQAELQNRKTILSDFNGDYELFLKTSNISMPTIIIEINNYETFSEIYNDKYEDILLSLTRECIKVGIIFVFTISNYNDIRYRMSQNFKQKIVLQLNNSDDYYNIIEGVGKKRPSKLFGRGLIQYNQDIYEFQTAKISDNQNWNSYIAESINELSKKYKTKAASIPIMPDIVLYEEIKDYYKNINTLPLGISKDNLQVFCYNLEKHFTTLVTSKNIENAVNYVSELISILRRDSKNIVITLDAEKLIQIQDKELENNYNLLLDLIMKNKREKQNVICFIIGIDKFINNLEKGQSDFKEILSKTNSLGNFYFILVDNITRFKNHEFEDWYKTYVTNDSGIWVGSGVDDQYLINITSNRKKIDNNCGQSYGYIISQGDYKLIKLIGMKDSKIDF